MRECAVWLRSIFDLKKKTSTGAVRKDDEYCALCSSAAAAVAIGQLQLHPSHYSLALQAFCFPKCDFWGGLEGASKKNFIGSLSLAIFSGPLINYAIIRPLLRATEQSEKFYVRRGIHRSSVSRIIHKDLRFTCCH